MNYYLLLLKFQHYQVFIFNLDDVDTAYIRVFQEILDGIYNEKTIPYILEVTNEIIISMDPESVVFLRY